MSSSIAIRSQPAPNTVASVYGTTPGGTPRISYSREELLSLAASPLSRSPPAVQLPAAIQRHTPVQPHTHHRSRNKIPIPRSNPTPQKLDSSTRTVISPSTPINRNPFSLCSWSPNCNLGLSPKQTKLFKSGPVSYAQNLPPMQCLLFFLCCKCDCFRVCHGDHLVDEVVLDVRWAKSGSELLQHHLYHEQQDTTTGRQSEHLGG